MLVLILALLAIILLKVGVYQKVYASLMDGGLVIPVVVIEEKPTITHAQDVWISSLEWCESKAKPTAINPKDKDGTPSYYSFQFKPYTFKSYGELYGVIEKGLSVEKRAELIKSQPLQRKIVENMVNDKKVVWMQQFPGCVKKLGYPPKY